MDIEKTYDIPIETSVVYAAWISSKTVIAPAVKMRVSPKVGGAYQLFMPDDGASPSCQGQFYEVFANSRLRYSWKWQGEDETTDISVSFSPTAQGTRLTILHQGFLTDASREAHAKGWDSYIKGLTDFLRAKS